MKNLVAAPVLFIPVFALLSWASAETARAADKNKCGCYKDGAGTCFCDKKAKCGCPGDCEPKGCEQAREKQIQKEIEAETKKAAEADRKHAAVSTKGAKGSTAEKKSAADGADDGARSTKESSAKESTKESKSGGAEPAAGHKLTPAQAKQLVKLLDAYFAENPDARSRNVEEVRNQLSQSR